MSAGFLLRVQAGAYAIDVPASPYLLACTGLNLPAQLGVLTGVLLIHNSFGAMQDVAIDALAVNTLRPDERGLANGVMFAGASLGTAVGGAGVLFLMPVLGLKVGMYHGKMGKAERDAAQQSFMRNNPRIMVATRAMASS